MWSLKVWSLRCVAQGELGAGRRSVLSGCMQATTFEATTPPPSNRATKSIWPSPLHQYAGTGAIPPRHRGITTARKRPARSWSIPTTTISITVLNDGKRSATALPSARSHGLVRHCQGRQHDRVPRGIRPRARSNARRSDLRRARNRIIRWLARDVSLFGRQGHAVPDSRTNQPEYIGASISSGCIRMTN